MAIDNNKIKRYRNNFRNGNIYQCHRIKLFHLNKYEMWLKTTKPILNSFLCVCFCLLFYFTLFSVCGAVDDFICSCLNLPPHSEHDIRNETKRIESSRLVVLMTYVILTNPFYSMSLSTTENRRKNKTISLSSLILMCCIFRHTKYRDE